MKKYMILLIFLKFLIINADSSIDIIFKGKCEDDKSKIGACMYEINNYDLKDHDKYSIFDKCGKGEKCIGYEMCVKDFTEKKRKIGKSCNYNEDCLTNSCVSNKCVAAKEGDKCDNISCDSGLTCYDSYENNNYISKCVKPAKEGEKEEKTNCMGGLIADKDNKCVKYGTIEDKGEIGYLEFICKSGFAHHTSDGSYICDSIDVEPECDEHGIKKEGKWSDGTAIKTGCMTKEDYTGKKISYSPYSKLRTKLYEEFLKDYKDLDLDKMNSDGKKWNWKTREKFILYQNGHHLKAAGIIDSEGKVVKKCEYEFIMKNYLHSNFIKLNTIIIAMIALLF
jgi:hypothetical protein